MSDQETKQRTYADGAVIFADGERAGEAYILQRGQVHLSKLIGGREQTVDTVEPGQVFGEMAILGDMPRMATAHAVGDVVCGAITRQDFQTRLDRMGEDTRDMVNFLIVYARDVMPRGIDTGELTHEDAEDRRQMHDRVREMMASGLPINAATSSSDPLTANLIRSLIAYASRRLPRGK